MATTGNCSVARPTRARAAHQALTQARGANDGHDPDWQVRVEEVLTLAEQVARGGGAGRRGLLATLRSTLDGKLGGGDPSFLADQMLIWFSAVPRPRARALSTAALAETVRHLAGSSWQTLKIHN